MSQRELVLQHCKKYGSITQLEATNEYGILRLSERIRELEREGYVFKRETKRYKNKSGRIRHYMRYILDE